MEIMCSPFGGIPRNWKMLHQVPPIVGGSWLVPPSGGSLEIGKTFNDLVGNMSRGGGSPFGGIPRNWKTLKLVKRAPSDP